MKTFLFILTLGSFLCLNGHSHTYTRPAPSESKILDPINLTDVYSANITYQIHTPLFVQEADYQYKSSLIKKYSNSKDRKIFSFELNKKFFHDGKKLECQDIKRTYDFYIKKKGNGYKRLVNLVGFTKADIKLESKGNHCHLSLKTPDDDLIKKLSSIKLSILDPKRNPRNGLGNYKIKEHSAKKTVLVSTSKRVPFDSIIIQKADKKIAIDGFISGKYDDLFMYTMDSKDLIKIPEDLRNVVSMKFPKTYYMFLNAKRHPSVKDRREMMTSIDWGKLLSLCYPDTDLEHSYVPRNYLGHKKFKLPTKRGTKKKLTLHIHQTDQNENCVQSFFKKYASHVDAEIVSISHSLGMWGKKQIDGMFTFLESDADSDLDIASAFVQNDTLFLGTPNKKLEQLYKKLQETSKLLDLDQGLKKFYGYLFEDYVALPLFNPSQNLIYSKRFAPIRLGTRSYLMFKIEEFVLKGKK